MAKNDPIVISEEEWRDKVYACWLGKTIGGTLGAPYELTRSLLTLSFYNPAPDKAAPNDDLDLQLIWLAMLEETGSRPGLPDFSRWWQKAASAYPWNEYGFCNRNLARGLRPPVSGCFENHYLDEMGAPIRSEIWACIAPADPQTAACLAWYDAALDHAGGEGTWGEMFWAAVESAAFVEQDPLQLINIGLQMIPLSSRVARVTREVLWCHRHGKPWVEVRDKILAAFGQAENPCHAVQNQGFIILGWLYGNSFGDKLCRAVNCGYDTDCTGATLGALLGILGGTKNIPEAWAKPIGKELVLHRYTRLDNPPQTLSELTERTLAVGRRFVRERCPGVAVRKRGDTRRPADLLSRLARNRLALRAGSRDPAAAVESVNGLDVWFHYNGEPVLREGVARTVGIHLERNGETVPATDVALKAPATWTCAPEPDDCGRKMFRLFTDKPVPGMNRLEVRAGTGGETVKTSFVMLGPDEARGFPANTQAGNCPRCQGWPGACLCRPRRT